MTQPNIPRLRKAVEWVEFNAELPEIDRDWMQESYIAGPVDRACRMLRSMDLVPRAERVNVLVPHCKTAYCVAGYIGQLGDKRYERADVVNGVHVGEYARQQLGLTQHQANLLFDGSNDAPKIRRLCEEFAGEPL